jgi:hypothetical protein
MIDVFSRFLDHYYRRRPVNATFTGMHIYDGTLPDWSSAGLAAMDEEMRQLIELLAAEHPAPESARAYHEQPELLDAELMRGFCEIQLSENASGHGVRGNPALWTGEAVFSIIALMIRDHGTLNDRLRAAVERMYAIPAFLTEARVCLGEGPLNTPWVEKALRDCEGAAILFTTGVEAWMASDRHAPTQEPWERAAAAGAAEAFAGFADWLRDRPSASPTAMACGATHYDLLLTRGHQIRQARTDLLATVRAQLDDAGRALDGMAAEAAGSWAAVQERLAEDHPSEVGYLGAFEEEWEACHRTIVDADIVTWPEWPITYDEIPPFTRDAAPYLYYLFYRSPAPLEPYYQHVYVVPPLPEGDATPHLRVWNRSVIKLNHVLHHGGVGHHLQNWYAYHRAAARVAQLAAVDCANRIGMFCGGTMAEGWACYATGLMGELDGLTPLERVAEQHAQVRQLTRAVVDLSFHAGELSFDDAVALFVDRAGMTPAAARGEVVKCSMFPGTAVMYWLGTQGILDLRATVKETQGDDFSLKRFHDDLLHYGSIPVPLVARIMTGGVA